MQFTMTTDYALRIVTYLSQKGDVVTTSNGMNLRKILFLKFVPLLLCLSY